MCVCVCVCVCVSSKSQAKAVVKRMIDERENPVRSEASVTWRFRDRSIGSRGMVDRDSFMNLLLFLDSSGSTIGGLFCGLSSIALRESYSIWCSCNCPSDS